MTQKNMYEYKGKDVPESGVFYFNKELQDTIKVWPYWLDGQTPAWLKKNGFVRIKPAKPRKPRKKATK